MEIGIVRIESVRLSHFRNVGFGEIFFSEKKKVEKGIIDDVSLSPLLGIYGQNGSGKTSALLALRIIQFLLSGRELRPTICDYIQTGFESFTIAIDFLVRRGDTYSYATYEIEIGRAKNRSVRVYSEKLSFTKFAEGERKANLFSFTAPDKINPAFLKRMDAKNQAIYRYVCVHDTGNENEGMTAVYSSVFSKNLSALLEGNKEAFPDYYNLVVDLQTFAESRLAIYSISYFNENDQVGIRLRLKEEKGDDPSRFICQDLFIPFAINQLPRAQFEVLKTNLDRINKVMPAIIPNYKVEIINVMVPDPRKMDPESSFINFVLASNRGNGPVPLQYESNGIKKIISILSGFIDAYNHEGCTMVVDELDSGIFEYLLGELVYAFGSFGMGQLIFTSHNMRVLEKLSHKHVFFSTTDNNNAFTQITNVHETNNLRDLYYRYIATGLKDGTKLFDMVNTEDIVAGLSSPEEQTR